MHACLCCCNPFNQLPVLAGERRSRRARKNRQPIKACSTDTLAMLRLKVFEVLSVHPQNQRLYVRGQLLQGEQDTLAKVCSWPDASEAMHVQHAPPKHCTHVPHQDMGSYVWGAEAAVLLPVAQYVLVLHC